MTILAKLTLDIITDNITWITDESCLWFTDDYRWFHESGIAWLKWIEWCCLESIKTYHFKLKIACRSDEKTRLLDFYLDARDGNVISLGVNSNNLQHNKARRPALRAN